MAHYAKAKGGMPFHKREEERRWKDHLSKHQKKVKRTKPTISNLDKTIENRHLQLKLKRLQLQEDRLSTIEYENQKLLEKINRVDKRADKQTWNELYAETPRKPKRQTPRSDAESSYESSDSSSSDNKDMTTDTGRDYEDTSTRASSSEIMNSVRAKEKEEIEEENQRLKERKDEAQRPENERESTHEYMHRHGFEQSAGGYTMVQDNDKLNKRLVHILKMDPNTKIDGESEDQRMERRKIIEEAREAVRKENEILKGKPERKSRSNGEYDDRVIENMRLNRKIKEIKKGRGKPALADPSYNSHDRWWVTSPRGREKVAYERDKKQLLEDAKKRRIQRKQQRSKEEKKILKQMEEEERQKKNSVPDGYHKKKRKRKSAINREEKAEELPDTSIVTNDPYDNVSLKDSDDEESS